MNSNTGKPLAQKCVERGFSARGTHVQRVSCLARADKQVSGRPFKLDSGDKKSDTAAPLADLMEVLELDPTLAVIETLSDIKAAVVSDTLLPVPQQIDPHSSTDVKTSDDITAADAEEKYSSKRAAILYKRREFVKQVFADFERKENQLVKLCNAELKKVRVLNEGKNLKDAAYKRLDIGRKLNDEEYESKIRRYREVTEVDLVKYAAAYKAQLVRISKRASEEIARFKSDATRVEKRGRRRFGSLVLLPSRKV